VNKIPIFPLRSVLCPGVALPLHIFEDRYRLMVERCLGQGEPFGVVLIREGRETGPLSGDIAAVGTTAAIRRAGRHADGRLDILTVGQRRFHLESVDSVSEPYLVGSVRFLEEPTGPESQVQRLADQVGRRFMGYLERLQPDGADDGPEIEIEFEIEADEDATDEMDIELTAEGFLEDDDPLASGADDDALARIDGSLFLDDDDPQGAGGDTADLSSAQRRELLMTAARRLVATEDPTALSYVLTTLVQVDLARRQALLEVPDTLERLSRLDEVLVREIWFLDQGLRPIIIDAGGQGSRSS
jgi:Lon protease-like protein